MAQENKTTHLSSLAIISSRLFTFTSLFSLIFTRNSRQAIWWRDVNRPPLWKWPFLWNRKHSSNSELTGNLSRTLQLFLVTLVNPRTSWCGRVIGGATAHGWSVCIPFYQSNIIAIPIIDNEQLFHKAQLLYARGMRKYSSWTKGAFMRHSIPICLTLYFKIYMFFQWNQQPWESFTGFFVLHVKGGLCWSWLMKQNKTTSLTRLSPVSSV